ncbi:MAG: alpha-hydroxy-acid oxidizing protein [Candidatus Eisenbacteria bacterium]|nr:alpha-hydroxy-acid oxidizing protein [Candidatus Eisenbacteria bacterium]
MSSAPINVADYEALARERMSPGAFDYYAGGAGDEQTLAANLTEFRRVFLRPRVLVDTSGLDCSTELFGARIAMPILVAPTAFHRLAHPDGELATARAAGAAGTIMCVSTVASHPLEAIAAAATGPLWFQLYVYKERALTEQLVRRAEAAGYRALVLTVDTPMLGRRERDARNAFQLPEGITLGNFAADHPLVARPAPDGGHADFQSYIQYFFDGTLTWESIAWLRSITRLPLLVKGVLTAEDARHAVHAGVAGIIVSNHGGRQLDGAVPTLRALPDVADAVGRAVPVLMDGGVRRGVDVLKALSLGADAVLVGRACLWGLAAAGEPGVRHVLDLLRGELELAMALAGTPTLKAVSRSMASIE